MLSSLGKLFGSKNDRELKRMAPVVTQVAALEAGLEALSDAELCAKTPEFRRRIEQGETLDALLPESFAVVREAMKRTIDKRHFDVQILGGLALHQGKIAEMKTGEGKTFVATLPAYLNALGGRGVHVVTVNDYLARRDAAWMGAIHEFLGLSVGCVVPGLSEEERRRAYACDITYGTNNEFGFDYLRDNMKLSARQYVQRELHYAIVDEVDSILIDEARTPLIISGASEQSTEIYQVANQVVPRLTQGSKAEPRKGTLETGDYWVDEEHSTVSLTEQGVHTVEKLLRVDNLYDPNLLSLLHAVNQALSAHGLKNRDVDYVVQAGEQGGKEVVIVDEFTGRLMPGRRWSDGLHQAVEAKEGIRVQSESQTYASITYQNYFRMYEKLSGMTGTADTEAPEFAKIYDLDVLVVPTNRPMIRDDLPDVIFKSEREKFDAVVEDILSRHADGQPVLVGTISIETSERLSKRLKKQGVAHKVLNAKHHQREAEIIAQAGRLGGVTISTNMAGRGTDIVLGGNAEQMALDKCKGDREAPEFAEALAGFEAACEAEREQVLNAGGLHILGTERHESRRIDNQLRGRSGRQGDAGSSQFYLSMEDDLMRIFGGERIQSWMGRLGLQDGEAIEHRMVTRAIENAQKKVEARNFDIRKHLLDYDNVLNLQRRTFYDKRRELLTRSDLHGETHELVEGVLVDLLDSYWPEKGGFSDENFDGFRSAFETEFGVALEGEVMEARTGEKSDFGRAVLGLLLGVLDEKKRRCDALAAQHAELGYPSFTEIEREVLLSVNDRQWKDHLQAMEGLRDSVSFRGYAQRDPKLEYQREGFGMFEEMNRRVDRETACFLCRLSLPEVSDAAPALRTRSAAAAAATPQAAAGAMGQAAMPGQTAQTAATTAPGRVSPSRGAPVGAPPAKVGRNQPCPCGSGKKYKKCCGVAGRARL